MNTPRNIIWFNPPYIYIYKQISSDFNRRALVYFPYKFVLYRPCGLHSSVDLQSEFE